MKKLIFDADSIAYRLAYSIEREKSETFNDIDNIDGDFEGTVKSLDERIYDTINKSLKHWMAINKADSYSLHLTASYKLDDLFKSRYDGIKRRDCFRYKIAKEGLTVGYKSNRTLEPLTLWEPFMACMVNEFNASLHDYVEADDIVVAIMNSNSLEYDPTSVAPNAKPAEYMLCALDKDVLNQVPGVHFNYGKLEPHVTTKRQARMYKYFQCITGDPGDGYKGVPGIGPAKAGRYINEDMTEQELWNGTVKAYKMNGLSEKEALATLRLADMTQVRLCASSGLYGLYLAMGNGEYSETPIWL